MKVYSGSFWRLSGAYMPGWGVWFRVCGKGLHVTLAKAHRKLFSERSGSRRALYVLGLRIEVLR